jgi:hypothetical protein
MATNGRLILNYHKTMMEKEILIMSSLYLERYHCPHNIIKQKNLLRTSLKGKIYSLT